MLIKTLYRIFIGAFFFVSALFLIQAQAMPEVNGFAAVEGNGLKKTTGGEGGKEVVAKNQDELARYTGSSENLIIKIEGSITISPLGKEIAVKSNKTIIGIGKNAEIVKGGFNLNGVSNIIFRNLTIRDSFLEGDWDGKQNDFDGIQMDNCHHIWIDHCRFARAGDGLVDSRKGTSYVTVSWTIMEEHNKAFGIGWTGSVSPVITIHHTWFRDIAQRNPSADNVKHCHLYNNFMEDLHVKEWSYGNWCRGGTHMLIENSVYHNVRDPHFTKNPLVPTNFKGALKVINPLYDEKCVGQKVMSDGGNLNFDPKDFYEYNLHPVENVEKLLRKCAGPQENFDCEKEFFETTSSRIAPIQKPVQSKIVISSVGKRSVLMNFQEISPQSISIYSLDGKLQYQKTGDLGMIHQWEASKTGIYQLSICSKSNQTTTHTIFITN